MLNQGSFNHVKVGPTPVLALHNTHVTRHPGVWSRKQTKKYLEKIVLIIRYQIF